MKPVNAYEKEDSMMKKMTIIAIVVAVVISIFIPMKVQAARKCSYPDCDRSVGSATYCNNHKCGHDGCSSAIGGNGTIYCNTHAAEYVRKKGYTPCADSGCYEKPSKGHTYCSKHECKESDCKKKKESGCSKERKSSSSYCFDHTCHKAGCNSQIIAGSIYCSSHKTTTYKSSTKRTIDDVDAESFYLDNKDEFEDEDDAWDYLEDESDEWD